MLGHLQINKLIRITVEKRKHITYVYLGVLHICGVQRDLVVYRIKLLCNWLNYERFTVLVINFTEKTG